MGTVTWMLELSVFLELFIGHDIQAAIISLLLFFNAIISFFRENRSQNALALLKKKLSIQVEYDAMEFGKLFHPRNWFPAMSSTCGLAISFRLTPTCCKAACR